MARTAGQTGLKISSKKTKHLSRTAETAIMLRGDEIENAEDFAYLGSKLTTSGGTEVKIGTRIFKASQAFAALRSTCESKSISTNTKIKLFKCNVSSTLL